MPRDKLNLAIPRRKRRMKTLVAITLIAASGFVYADPPPKPNYTYVVHNPYVDQQAWRDYLQARRERIQEKREAGHAEHKRNITTVGTIKIGQNSPSPAELFNAKIK
jgi:hypothetical protein